MCATSGTIAKEQTKEDVMPFRTRYNQLYITSELQLIIYKMYCVVSNKAKLEYLFNYTTLKINSNRQHGIGFF